MYASVDENVPSNICLSIGRYKKDMFVKNMILVTPAGKYGHLKGPPQSPRSKLISRTIRASKGHGFAGDTGMICCTQLRLSREESVNVVTSKYMDNTYGRGLWRTKLMKMMGTVHPRQGLFQNSVILGDMKLLFFTENGDYFHIPFRVVENTEENMMILSSSWIFHHYSYCDENDLVLSLYCTDSSLLLSTPTETSQDPYINERSDLWFPRHVIKPL